MLNPQVIICDEPVSALDVSVQAQILNMLEDLKADYGLTLVFIAHDLAVVKNISDRIAVMYLGKLCEVSESNVLYDSPAHPYTELLLGSSPVPDPTVNIDITLVEEEDLPSPIDPPSGCRFRTRCRYATDRCAQEEPMMRQVSQDHYVACHHPLVSVVEERAQCLELGIAHRRGHRDEAVAPEESGGARRGARRRGGAPSILEIIGSPVYLSVGAPTDTKNFILL